MSKRFTESKIWDDVWFQELPAEWKLLWKYICDKCDEAGIWKINYSLAEFQLKTKIEWEQTDKFINNGKQRLEFYNGFWLIKDFVVFQYGEKAFTSVNPFHQKVRSMLERVSKRVSNTPSNINKVMVMVKEKGVRGGRVSCIIPPSKEEVVAYQQEIKGNILPDRFIDFYTSNGWMVGRNKMKDWKASYRRACQEWDKDQISLIHKKGSAYGTKL